MKKYRLLLVILFLFLREMPLSAMYLPLIPQEDVYIDEQFPSLNFDGQGLYLSAQNMGPVSFHKDICIRFSIPPVYDPVIGGVLKLFPNTSIANVTQVSVYAMGGPWFGSTLTWNDATSLTGSYIGTYSVTSSAFEISLPASLLQSWNLDPSTNFGVRIKVEGSIPPVQTASYFDVNNPDITAAPQLVIGGSFIGPGVDPIAIIGPDSVCEGEYVAFETFPYMMIPGCFFNFSVPPGWTVMTQNENSIWVQAGPGSGYIRSWFDCCQLGSSDTLGKYVTVTAPGLMPGYITGPDSGCGGDTLNFTLTPVTGDTSWYWEVPGSWLILSGQGTASVTIVPPLNAVSYFIKVRVDNFCNSGEYAYYYLQIKSPPANPVITGQQFVQQNSVVDYSASSALASSYLWSIPPGASIITHDANYSHISVLYSTTSGQLCVQGINECAYGATTCWPINFTTGIEETAFEPGLQISSGEKGIISIYNHSGGPRLCEVFSVSGAIVIEGFSLASQSERLLHLKPGLYFIRCGSNHYSHTYKVCSF